MRLTPPTKLVFYIAAALAIIGILAFLLPTVPVLSILAPFATWLVFAGWLLLAAGNALKGF